MYPNIFVSEDFFNFFDEEYDKLPQENLFSSDSNSNDKRKSLYRIKDLFLASNIYSDIIDKSLIKYHTKQFGTYSNFKDFILHSKIRDASFANKTELRTRQNKDDCKKSGFCYFTKNSFEEADIESRHTGKIIAGEAFLKRAFYLEHTFGSEATDEKIFQVVRVKHPCSGIIIMDRYLFDDVANQTSKVKNLISFLNEIISTDLIKPFEIDIITENRENNSLFDLKYNEILAAFPNKISLHIYAPKKINPDRYIITNYSVFSVGHPFMPETNVSCNFFPSNNNVEAIINSYKIWKEKIILANEIINKTTNPIGLYKTSWKSDTLKHLIFNL